MLIRAPFPTQGEYGDPVVEPKTKRQVGITSWGFGCDNRRSLPQVFVDLGDPEIRRFVAAQLKK